MSFMVHVYDHHKRWRHITDIEDAETIEEAKQMLEDWLQEIENSSYLPVYAKVYRMEFFESFVVDSEGVVK